MNERRARSWPRAALWPALAGARQFPPHLLLAALALASVLTIHLPTVSLALVTRTADSSELSEAILVPLAALWLVFTRREQLLALTVGPWWPGLLAVAAATGLWLAADLMNINVVRELAVVAMVQAIVPTVLGVAWARALALPLAMLVLAANVFFPLVAPLMHLTAESTVAALRLSGVRASLDGLTIVTPAGRWEVIEACSGVTYLRVFAVAGTLFAAVAAGSVRRRSAIIGASLIAAVAANILREWAVTFLANVPGAGEPDHDVVGWICFSALFVALLALGRRLGEPRRGPGQGSLHATAATPGSARGSALAAIAAVAIAGTAPAAMAAWEHQSTSAGAYDGCRLIQGGAARGAPSPVRMRTLCSGPAGRRQLADVAPSLLHAVAPAAVLVTGTRRVESPGRPDGIEAATLTTLEAKVPYRLTYWYEVGDSATGSWIRLKWHLALALLTRRDSRVTVVSELQELDASR